MLIMPIPSLVNQVLKQCRQHMQINNSYLIQFNNYDFPSWQVGPHDENNWSMWKEKQLQQNEWILCLHVRICSLLIQNMAYLSSNFRSKLQFSLFSPLDTDSNSLRCLFDPALTKQKANVWSESLFIALGVSVVKRETERACQEMNTDSAK